MRMHPLLAAFLTLVIFLLVAPLVIVIGASFSDTNFLTFPPRGLTLRWFQNIFAVDAFRSTMLTSFELGVFGTLLSLLVGIPAAYALNRYRIALPGWLANIYVLPVLVPEIVLGFALMKLVIIGMGTPYFLGLLIGHAVLVLPYAVRVVSASLAGFDFTIEEAAVSLGSPRVKTFFTVVLPNIRAGVIAAFILAFITSINDVSTSLFLTGPGVSTLPIQILAYMNQFFDPTVAAVSVLLMVVTVIVMAGVEATLGLTFLTRQQQ